MSNQSDPPFETPQADHDFEQQGWKTHLNAEQQSQLAELEARHLKPVMSVTSYTQPKTMTLLLWDESDRVVATSNPYTYPSHELVTLMFQQVFARADRFD